MGFLDDALGKSAIKDQKDLLKQIMEMLAGGGQFQTENLYSNILPRLERQEKEIASGFDKARGEVSRMGYSSKRSVLDREQQQLGRGAQSLTQRGLGNSSVLGSLNRGVQSGTDRSLAAIDEALAGMQSQLLAGKGQAVGGALGNQASAFGQHGGNMLDLLRQKTGLLGNVQYEGGGLGALLGSFPQQLMSYLPFLL
jgi:hypothetical protein